MNRIAHTDVSVTIGAELRAMFAARRRIATYGGSLARSSTPGQSAPKIEDSSDDAFWKRVKLRSDGERPLSLVGVKVLTFCGQVSISGLKYQHELTLYLNDRGQFYLAMHLTPLTSNALRPWYRATVTDLATCRTSFELWLNDLSAWFKNSGDEHAKQLPDTEIRNAIQLLSCNTIRHA